MRKALIVSALSLPLWAWAQGGMVQDERVTLESRNAIAASTKTGNSSSEPGSVGSRGSNISFAAMAGDRQSQSNAFGRSKAKDGAASVSEPGAYALTLAAMAVVGFIARRLNRN